MNRVNFIQPFAHDKNIGREYNLACGLVPDGEWICITDQDSMFLRSDAGQHVIEMATGAGAGYDLIGCLTNRIGLHHLCYGGNMSDDPDIAYHIKVAHKLVIDHKHVITPINHVVAGFFMLFPKKTWELHNFKEHSISFDTDFSKAVLKRGGKIGVMQGLYRFHLYRWGQANPKSYNKHLI